MAGFLPALRAAAGAYRATKGATAYPITSNTNPALAGGGEAWRILDAITNGWAAVSSAFGAFWGALRDWGGTGYRDLAASVVANPVAGRAMRLLCDNASAVPVLAFREGRDGEEEAPDLPALAAIERAGWAEIVGRYLWALYCGGEAFVLKAGPTTGPSAGTVRALSVLRNDLYVRTEFDALGDPVRYVFQRPAGRGGTDTYDAADVLHLKNFNPLDPERGLPVALSARRPLTLVEEADAWNRGIARGGGRVPGYLMPEGLQPGQMLDRETLDKAQSLTDAKFRERKAANEPMVMSGAFRYVDGSVSPREADWLRGRAVSMREIAAVFGVPATLLADEKAGSLTDAGVDSEVAALYKLTIIPAVTRLLDALTDWLCADGESLRADWDQVPALGEDMDAKFKRYGAAVRDGLVTRREARVALAYGADPEPGFEDDPPVPPIVTADETDPPAVRALKGLTDDGFDHLLKLIPDGRPSAAA